MERRIDGARRLSNAEFDGVYTIEATESDDEYVWLSHQRVGTAIDLWSSGHGPEQKWKITATGEQGVFTIEAIESDDEYGEDEDAEWQGRSPVYPHVAWERRERRAHVTNLLGGQWQLHTNDVMGNWN